MSQRLYFQFSFNIESGSAMIDSADLEEIESMIEEDPLLAADCLKDLAYQTAQLYEMSVKSFSESLRPNTPNREEA